MLKEGKKEKERKKERKMQVEKNKLYSIKPIFI